MSVRVMTWVFDHATDVSGNNLTVLLAIADRCNDEGFDAYPSIEALAKKVHCHRATVIRAIQHLEAIQILRVTREQGDKNRYAIIMQPRLQPVADDVEPEPPAAPEPVAICDPSQSATGSNLQPVATLQPVAPVQREPVALLRPNTSCTSISPPARANQSQPDTGRTVIGEAAKPRRQSTGPLAGSLPRDHINHGWCGSRFCVTSTTLARYARRHSADPEQSRAAVEAWLQGVHDALGPEDASGGNLWLDDLFDTWLVDLGKVKPVAPGLRSSRRRDEPATARVPDADATKATLDQIRGWMS